MRIWTILDFIAANEENVIETWFSDQGASVRAAVEDRLQKMARLGKTDWPRPWIKARNDAPRVFELRIAWNKVQYRPLATYGPDRHEITLLVGTIEKGGKIKAADIDTARKRRELIFKDRRYVREHDFDGD